MTIRQEQLGGITELDSESTGAINANSAKITNLATPVADTDAATKGYVDANIGGPVGTPSGSVQVASPSISMAPQIRNFISGGDNFFYLLYDTGMVDSHSASIAGADLVASHRGIHVTGTLNGVEGKHYSLTFSGLEFGEDFDFSTDLTPPLGNACAFIGYSVDGNYFNTWNIAANGVASNIIYQMTHSTPDDVYIAASSDIENWEGTRATFILKGNNTASEVGAVTCWTVPLENKVYIETIFSQGLQSTVFANSPKAICSDGDGYLWVSFSNDELIQYATGNSDSDYGTLTEIKKISNVPQMIDMVCDGASIWGISNASFPGQVFKINISTDNILTYNLPANTSNFLHSNSRILFNGVSVFVSAYRAVLQFEANQTTKICPIADLSIGGLLEVRGLAVDTDNNLYAAAIDTSNPLNTLKIFKHHITFGGGIPSTEEFSYTWMLGNNFVGRPSPFNFINLQSLSSSIFKFAKHLVIELTISANGGGLIKAMWKKLYLINHQAGVFTIVHDADLTTPYLHADATNQGWDLSLTGGATLIGTLTHGTSVNPTIWNINLKLRTDNKEMT